MAGAAGIGTSGRLTVAAGPGAPRTLDLGESVLLPRVVGVSADGHCANVCRGLEEAHGAGLLTVALAGGDGGRLATSPSVDHLLVVASEDPEIVKEVHVTTYHILWELVHVFFEHPGVLEQAVTA